MTIASQTSRISYNGDGSVTAFAVTFKFLANSDLVVYLRDAIGGQTLQVLGTNYSVSGAGLDVGGTVTFVLPPASGYTVVIYRDPPVTQTTSYNNNDPFPAKSHENALDKLTMLIQRLVSRIGRAPLLAESSSYSNLTLPDPEAGKYLKWKQDVTGLENSAATTIAPNNYAIATQSEAEGMALNTVLMTPLSSVQQARVFDTRVDVRKYGAIGDANDSHGAANLAAFQAAIDAVASTGGTVFVPNGGDYRINGTLNIFNRHSIKIESPGNAGTLFDSASNTRLCLTSSSDNLFRIDGSEGIEFAGLNLTYNNPAYGGDLIDLQQHTGGILTTGVHIHHCRIGGILGVADSANSLIRTGDTLKLVVEHGFMDQGSIGILGSDNSTATNCVVINDIWFDGGWGQLPIIAGGQSWTLQNCIFERRSDLLAAAIQTTNAGVLSFNIIGNRFDDGETTGTWININNGPIWGGQISCNFFRNGARAINLGSSKGIAISGNTFYTLENTPPIVPGTSTGITSLSNLVETDSGLNIPNLFTARPTGISFIDNNDGLGPTFGASSRVTNGYRHLPDGMIEQWAAFSVTNSAALYNWPIAFPTSCLNAQVTTKGVGATDNVTIASGGFTATQISLVGSGSLTAYVRAIGY